MSQIGILLRKNVWIQKKRIKTAICCGLIVPVLLLVCSGLLWSFLSEALAFGPKGSSIFWTTTTFQEMPDCVYGFSGTNGCNIVLIGENIDSEIKNYMIHAAEKLNTNSPINITTVADYTELMTWINRDPNNAKSFIGAVQVNESTTTDDVNYVAYFDSVYIPRKRSKFCVDFGTSGRRS